MKVLVIGSTVCDVIINIEKVPQPGEDQNILSQSLHLGGCAYNVASALNHFNVPFDLFSPIGQGFYGQFVESQLTSRNIPILLHSKETNGCCYCLVDQSGERTFLCEHGGEYHFYPNDFTRLNPDDYEYVYVCGLEIEEKTGDNIINFLESNDFKVVFAPSPRFNYIAEDKMNRMLHLSPIIHLNKDEILSFTHADHLESAARQLYSKTHNFIFVTLGKEGCYYYDGADHHLASYPCHVVDTIGAGDSHIGTIIAQLYFHQSLEKAVDEANQFASQIVSQKGSTMS